MTTPTLASLITSLTQSQIYQKLLGFCQSLGLHTETWAPGDTTKSTLSSMASRWAEREDPNTGFPAMIAGGLLGLAAGDWLTLLLAQNYGTIRRAATNATCQIQITNPTGANFGTFNAGDLTVSQPGSPSTPTYRNATAFTLGPNQTISTDIAGNPLLAVADIAGSGGSANPGTITAVVAPGLPGCSVTNLTAALGVDAELDDAATARGQTKFESLSPAGPRGAYSYAILTPELQSDGSNMTNITRVRPIEESDYGDTIFFLATASGAPSGADVTKAQATLASVSQPYVVGALAIGATALVVPITYELWVYDDVPETAAAIVNLIAAQLAASIAGLDIGGSIIPPATSGFLYVDWIKAQIQKAIDAISGAPAAGYTFKLLVTAPATDVPVAFSYNSTTPSSSVAQVVTLGTPTATAIHLVPR